MKSPAVSADLGEDVMRTKSINFNGHKPPTNGARPHRTTPPARRQLNGNHRPPVPAAPSRATDSAVGKFIVALTAGCSLVFLPPLVTTLAFHDAEKSDVVLFTSTRVSFGIVVAVFIAIIASIQEYKRPARPWSVFMRALALPGLLIGSWQSLADNSQLRVKDRELHDAEEAGREAGNIPLISEALPLKPIAQETFTLPDTGIRYASLLPLDLFRAASPSLAPQSEPRYLIVVDRRPDSTAAAARAQELRPTCCPVAATRQERSATGWYVLESIESRTHSEALRRAVAIRNSYPELKLTPQLLPLDR